MKRPLSSTCRQSKVGDLHWQAPLILILAGILAYANSFSVPLVFDGREFISNNPSLGRLWPWHYAFGQNRPVGFFTFALNYVWQGTEGWGYHAVNLAIHLAAGLALFGLVRRSLTRPPLASRYGSAANGLAFAVALLWLVHPLQTQSVTYVYQRLESLMGLFYFLTLYGFVRAQQSPRSAGWYALSVACCALGMGTKEVMATAPLLVLWYDRAFVTSSWRELFRQRPIYYAALASTWAILAALILSNWPNYQAHGVLIVKDVTPLGYALTQPGVILHYLRLAFWPTGQCLDYGWPLAQGFEQIVPAAVAILALLGLTAWSVWRYPAWGFVGGWFFLILAPTSSIAPMADVAFEHRMYLPLASVAVVVVIGVYELTRRLFAVAGQTVWQPILLAVAAAALGIATFQRNWIYRDEIAMWSDVLETSPQNGRAHVNRGALYASAGDCRAALADYGRAIALSPAMAVAYNNRAMLLASAPQSHWRNGKQAIEDARRACELTGWSNPATVDTLAAAYAEAGRFAQAIHWQQQAMKLGDRDSQFLREAQERLELYRTGKPFREKQ